MTDIDKGQAFRLGDWTVEPQLNRLTRDGRHVEMEPKSMAVLAYLAERPGKVVSSDEFIDVIWQGRPMGDNPVHRCISRLRQALGDDARRPSYIATVQRKGYRLVAKVGALKPDESAAASVATRKQFGWRAFTLIAVAIVVIAASIAMLRQGLPQRAPSIAVLSFESLDDSATHIAKGITEDVRTALADVSGIRVSSAGASDQFPPGTDPIKIHDILGVAWLLEGTTRLDGANLKVTARLIDAESRFEEWSDSYEGVIGDLFDIQSRIANTVVNSVVSEGPLTPILPIPGTDVIAAYNEFLRGQLALDDPHNDENLTRAERRFQEALSYDPGYARAYAGLCRTFVAWYAYSDSTAYVGKAEDACNAARSLDKSLSEVPHALGRLYRRQGRLEEAEAAFREALALNPNYVDALTGLAQTLAARGDDAGAERVFNEALAAHPNDWVIYTRLGRYYYGRGRYADAARMYRRVLDLRPLQTETAPFNNYGAALYMMGDFEMAARAFEESLRIRPNRSAHSNLGTLYYYLGRYDDAVENYRAAIELKPQDYVMWGNLGDALSRVDGAGEQAANAYREAIKLAQRQLEVNVADNETNAMVGSYFAHLGLLGQAETKLAAALEHSVGESYVLYYASVVYTIMGRYEEALTALEQAVGAGYSPILVAADPEFVPLRGHNHYRRLVDQ